MDNLPRFNDEAAVSLTMQTPCLQQGYEIEE
jgi:hypothetical protein